MQLTEFVVATHNEAGEPALFHLVYATGTVPGVEGARSAVGTALRRAGMRTEEGFVMFDQHSRRYPLLRAAVAGSPIVLNGLAPDDAIFTQHLTEHPDFRR